jgi:hypothetical protein
MSALTETPVVRVLERLYPNLLNHLAAPSCSRLGSSGGVHYVEPIEGAR